MCEKFTKIVISICLFECMRMQDGQDDFESFGSRSERRGLGDELHTFQCAYGKGWTKQIVLFGCKVFSLSQWDFRGHPSVA